MRSSPPARRPSPAFAFAVIFVALVPGLLWQFGRDALGSSASGLQVLALAYGAIILLASATLAVATSVGIVFLVIRRMLDQ